MHRFTSPVHRRPLNTRRAKMEPMKHNLKRPMSWPRVKTVKTVKTMVRYSGNKLRGLAWRLYGALGLIMPKGKNLDSDTDYENEVLDRLDDEFQPTVPLLPAKTDDGGSYSPRPIK
ncbi:hypothetical protein O1611_g8127 [Lasiodiplodia mahajangana]|uniref:Uncharacterized protein n=1 Tax=Lasiodiplodia mahajangana TaxID=1108764 RepID=A0ACC2JDA9_9PEZI|nr:hypothetical protein O1611_g8127 [Lasiodiplodia mahajangana]